MPDLRTRFQSLDSLDAPYLWQEVEARAAAIGRRPLGPTSLELFFITGLLALALLAAAALGGGSGRRGLAVASPSAARASGPGASTALASSDAPAGRHWRATGSLLDARDLHAAVLLANGLVLVAGGAVGPIDASPQLATAELYDPATGTWTRTGSMNDARRVFTLTRLRDGSVLATGGNPRGLEGLASAELYDPGTGTWTRTAPMAVARVAPSGTLLRDGRVLVMGGGSSGRPLGEVFDPTTGRWTPISATGAPRSGGVVGSLEDGRLLVAGSSPGTTVVLYDPVGDTWSAPGTGQPLAFDAGMQLGNGTVLFMAGVNPSGPGANGSVRCALYDPVGDTWTTVPEMATARMGFAAVLLRGTVLVIGGREHGGVDTDVYRETERFLPADQQWQDEGLMTTARTGHTATVLLDGRVLVVGGRGLGIDGPPLRSAELYAP